MCIEKSEVLSGGYPMLAYLPRQTNSQFQDPQRLLIFHGGIPCAPMEVLMRHAAHRLGYTSLWVGRGRQREEALWLYDLGQAANGLGYDSQYLHRASHLSFSMGSCFALRAILHFGGANSLYALHPGVPPQFLETNVRNQGVSGLRRLFYSAMADQSSPWAWLARNLEKAMRMGIRIFGARRMARHLLLQPGDTDLDKSVFQTGKNNSVAPNGINDDYERGVCLASRFGTVGQDVLRISRLSQDLLQEGANKISGKVVIFIGQDDASNPSKTHGQAFVDLCKFAKAEVRIHNEEMAGHFYAPYALSPEALCRILDLEEI